MNEREEKLRELIAKLEKQGCYCDVRAGWSCPMHGYLRELEVLLAEPPAPSPSLTVATVWIVTQNDRVHSVHASRESAEKENGENLRIDTPWAVLQDGKRFMQPAPDFPMCGVDSPHEAELRGRVLEEADKLTEKLGLVYLEKGDKKGWSICDDIGHALRALKSQVSVTGEPK